jgi:hypothetical protein
MSKFYTRKWSATALALISLTVFSSGSVYGMEREGGFSSYKSHARKTSASLLTQAAQAHPEDREIQDFKAPIKNLVNRCHEDFFSDVLEFLIKENSPTLGFKFSHQNISDKNISDKNISLKELAGEIQYLFVYSFLMQAFVAPNLDVLEQSLEEACEWNQKAALNGNRAAQKLSDMAFELVPLNTSIYVEVL